jgi:hypothetical protein
MVLKRALSILAMSMLAACPGTLDEMEFGEGGSTACPDIPAFFTMRCALSGCHTSMTPAGLLDLQSPNPGSRIIGVMSQCGGPLGDPANPDNSVILKKLKGNQCGTRMPLGLNPLSNGEIDCIKTWIANGGK